MKKECCAFCGTNSGSLKPYYALPIHLGGGDSDSNKIYVCHLHGIILEEVRTGTCLNSDSEIASLRIELHGYKAKQKELEKTIAELSANKQESTNTVIDIRSHRDSLLEELANREVERKSLAVNTEQSALSADIPPPEVEEFGENHNTALDESTVKLTLSTFDGDVLLSASTLGCTEDELKKYIQVEIPDYHQETNEDSLIDNQVDDTDITITATENDAVNDSVKPLQDNLPAIGNGSNYRVVSLSDCSILAKALERGVHYSSMGEPLIEQVGDERLKVAIQRNGWDRELFRDPAQITALLDQTIANEATKKSDLHKLSSVTGINNTFIIESMRRTKQSEDVINEVIRLTYVTGSPRARLLSRKWS